MTTTSTVNIAQALTEMARARPYAMAVACPAGRDGAGRAAYSFQTFQQLDRESDILARGLTVIGIGPGVRTALMVKPGHEFFALTFALFKAGAVPVLIDPGIGLKNMGKSLDGVEPGAFVGIPVAQAARRVLGWARRTVKIAVTVRPDDGRRRLAPLPDLSPRKRPGRTDRELRVLDETGFDPGLPDLDHLVSLSLAQVRRAGQGGEEAAFEAVVPTPGATDAILFTSGSTGPPKGVVYSHAIFNAQVSLLRDLYGIEPGEIDLCTFPLFALFAPALGMSSIVPEMDASRPARADPIKIVEAIETFGATNLFGSPALLKRVSDYGTHRGIKLPSLRRVISAGAPVSARLLEKMTQMLAPGVQVFTPYGATESLPVCSIGSDEILNETRDRTDAGGGVCVGRPVPGMRVEVMRIIEGDVPAWSDDLAVPEGTIGEIIVQGPVVTSKYFHNPEATLRAKMAASSAAILPGREEIGSDLPDRFAIGFHLASGEGIPGPVWHRMGDLGTIDAKGRLWFCGRKAHRVSTGEGTLFTIPVEAVFNTHPDVARTALVGVGPSGRSRPVLCVELKPGRWRQSDRDRIRRELLAIGSKQPHTSTITEILFHKSFPVDIRHNAKIFREKLAVWASRRVR